MKNRESTPKTLPEVSREGFVATDILPKARAMAELIRIITQQDNERPHRLLLEGICYIAHRPQSQTQDCRLFRSFANLKDSNWLLGVHDSLNAVRGMGWATKLRDGSYALTPMGEKDSADYIESNDIMPIQQCEVDTVLEAAKRVRTTFGLSRHLISSG